MKLHTSDFKDSIKTFGRELNDKVTYTVNNEVIELGNEELNSASPHYEGAILKSVMKQLDIDSNVEIPIGTVLNYQIGVKIGSEYEYVDYGNYVVYSIEKQEDTYSYKIVCYDKMLYAMKDYDNTGITYPTTVRGLLEAICGKIDLTYAEGQFANYDKEIPSELYLDSNGNSLGYTYRDVLDEIAQVSGGTICINNEDKVEVRYIHDVGELTTVSNSNITAIGEEAELQQFELEGKTTQAGTPSPSSPQELVSVGYQNLLRNTNNNDAGDNNYWQVYSTFDETTRTLTRSTTATTESYIMHRLNGLKSNTTYTLTLYAKSNGYVKDMDLYCFNENTQGIKSITGIKLTTEFKKYTLIFTTASDVVYGANSVIRIDNNGSTASGTEAILTVKDVCLVEGGKSCEYVDYGKYGINIKVQTPNELDLSYFTSQTINNLPITNDNGVLKFHGTNNDVISQQFSYYAQHLKQGTYHFSISLSGTISQSVSFIIYGRKNTGSAITLLNYDGRSNDGASFTISEDYAYMYLWIYIANGTVFNNYVVKPQLERGSVGTEFKPFANKNYVYSLDNPLRSIGDIKDKLYIKNGMLYVDRKIGKVVLNGSESNWNYESAYSRFLLPIAGCSTETVRKEMRSNYFKPISATHEDGSGFTYGGTVFLYNYAYNTTSGFKTWLSTHNTEVNFILQTPYTEELGNVDIPSTYKGITYIETTDTNEPTMNVIYISGFEEIDEEMMKDVNVNFGEKYGPINTVVLSRSAGADKVALSYPANLPDEEKIAIEISDNQIMNDLNRADYLLDLLHQLNRLEYYINDFSSTGICYLDLCDRYRAKVGDVSYKCIMFNDSVNRTQGLEEQIYTDMPEEAKEDYQYISDDDRKTTQAYIIAKKNEGEIVAVTNKVDEVNGKVNTVEARQTATETTLNFRTQNIDENGNITEVTTTNGFTFNAQGLDIHTSDNAFHTTIDEDSTEYKDGDTVVSTTSKDGSALRQLRMLEQNYYSYNSSNSTNIMDTSNYDFVDERVEDNGEYVYATFYNGED